jgi:hypothetical protein
MSNGLHLCANLFGGMVRAQQTLRQHDDHIPALPQPASQRFSSVLRRNSPDPANI